MKLRRYIYVSKLVANTGDNGLRHIMQRARENNLKRDLTGALLFDGESFAQLIEGQSDQVLAMISLIRVDSRHEAFTTVCDRMAVDGQRRYSTWQNGYVEPDAFDAFRSKLALGLDCDPLTALQEFGHLLAKADVI